MWQGVRFAVGLIEIGRPWAKTRVTPGEEAARSFLEAAYECGVRVFDTAPSYALSEERLGAFLKSLTAEERAGVYVATKFGETWSYERDEPDTDHSAEALKRSLEKSAELLGRIDLVQVHKSTPEVLRSEGLARGIEFAREMGVERVGASVKDLESAGIACTDGRFSQIQVPWNAANREMRAALRQARETGRMVFTNRPFGMGALLETGTVEGAIEAVLEEEFDGAVLFGTRSAKHLRENWEAFGRVVRRG